MKSVWKDANGIQLNAELRRREGKLFPLDKMMQPVVDQAIAHLRALIRMFAERSMGQFVRRVPNAMTV